MIDNAEGLTDFRLELKEEFKTFVLKDDHLLLERIRYQYDGWGKSSYIVKERYDYQQFKEIILKKEALKQPVKTDDKFVFTLTFRAKAKGSQEMDKFIFRNMRLENVPNEVGAFVVRHDYYEPFAKELITRLKNYPQVKIYAYETAKVKILNKINDKFPTFYIGGAVLGGAFFLKIISFLLKITFKLSFFYWLDAFIMQIGGIFTLLGFGGAYLINERSKKKSQIGAGQEIPPHFFPSNEKAQGKLSA
jgi:hypothetical protein